MKHAFAKINARENKIEFLTKDEKARELLEKPPYPLYEVWAILKAKGWVNCKYGDVPAINDGGYLNWWFPENDVEALELLLLKHDWYFQMSDDMRVVSSGSQSLLRIKTRMKQLDKEQAVSLWNKYAPEDMKMSMT